LIQVLNLDNLDGQGDPYPDGVFDYVEGVTVLSSNGRIIFPVLEPFGSHLYAKLGGEILPINMFTRSFTILPSRKLVKFRRKTDLRFQAATNRRGDPTFLLMP